MGGRGGGEVISVYRKTNRGTNTLTRNVYGKCRFGPLRDTFQEKNLPKKREDGLKTTTCLLGRRLLLRFQTYTRPRSDEGPDFPARSPGKVWGFSPGSARRTGGDLKPSSHTPRGKESTFIDPHFYSLTTSFTPCLDPLHPHPVGLSMLNLVVKDLQKEFFNGGLSQYRLRYSGFCFY